MSCTWPCASTHLEGGLFFGAAPELDRYLIEIQARIAGGARVIVLRVRRARNPDLVCLERLEHFVREMEGQGVPVLLSGVREALRRSERRQRDALLHGLNAARDRFLAIGCPP